MKRLEYNDLEAFVFKLWKREVSDELTGKETEIINQWNQRNITELDDNQIQDSKDKVLLQLEPYLPTSNKHIQINYFKKYFYQAAAIILLLISFGGILTYNTFFKPDTYIATTSKINVQLIDGSLVTLLPGAELRVDRSFPADTRLVDLKGDAIFKIAKSKIHPFVVQGEDFSTKVLGTVFKVVQSGKIRQVDLYEGKVEVSYSGTPASYLKPNQRWTNFGIPRTAAVTRQTQPSNVGSSELLSLSFNDVAFNDVVNLFQKNYQIKILYPSSIASKKITADFTGGSISENLESLGFILGLELKHYNKSQYELK